MSLPIPTTARAYAAPCGLHPCLNINMRGAIPRQRPGAAPRPLVRLPAPPTAVSPAAAPSAPADAPADPQARRKRPPRPGPAEKESLELLGWSELCRQVASFCQTGLGAQQAMAGRLPLGPTLDDSRALLRQTAEAGALGLSFEGVLYLRRAMDAAAAGQRLHPLVLGAVATTLRAVGRLSTAVDAAGGAAEALRHVARGARDHLPSLLPLVTSIEAQIHVAEGRVRDEASDRLAAARAARRANLAALRAAADAWARELHESGAAERPQVVVRRDRLCVPVRSGRQAELPRGSVALAASGSGSTVFMEPAPLVPLNNAEAVLAAEEAEEEERILAELTAAVAAGEKRIRSALAAAAGLDVATARARHARWLGALEPDLEAPEVSASRGILEIRGAVHPLLAAAARPPLPPPPLPEVPLSAAVDLSNGPLAGVNLVPELWKAMEAEAGAVSAVPQRRRRGGGGGASHGDGAAPEAPAAAQAEAFKPLKHLVPIDLTVPPGVNVVAVTGPNTGGKTASLKALGLLSLMVKAGMFVPVEGGPQGARPRAAWFDKVLADVGDGQSLQQSLSTFSGHVRRLRGVLKESTPASLVLLDEVGSGTDPAEGAALAAALLLRLADRRAALTYATTHHAELKDLAAGQPGFVNAGVEFDLASLRPTYRLLWGASGQSNALAVAAGLGFDPRVVEDARDVAGQLSAGATSAAARAAALHQSLAEQAAAAVEAAAEAEKSKTAAVADLEAARAALKAQQAEHAAAVAAAAKKKKAGKAAGVVEPPSAAEGTQAKVKAVLAEVRGGALSPAAADAELRRIERALADAAGAAMTLTGLKWGSGSEEEGEAERAAAPPGWAPRPGDYVKVLKMGGAVGQVAGSASGGKVAVRVGALTMQLRAADLAPAGGPPPRPPAAGPAAAKARLRASGSLPVSATAPQSSAPGSSPLGVAVQTRRNTVDVRGLSSDAAVAEVEIKLDDSRGGDVVFVVHGVGTGRVRAAVLEAVRRHPSVAKHEEAEASNGGCTVVYLR